jgi:hypothetical protein
MADEEEIVDSSYRLAIAGGITKVYEQLAQQRQGEFSGLTTELQRAQNVTDLRPPDGKKGPKRDIKLKMEPHQAHSMLLGRILSLSDRSKAEVEKFQKRFLAHDGLFTQPSDLLNWAPDIWRGVQPIAKLALLLGVALGFHMFLAKRFLNLDNEEIIYVDLS